DATRCRAFSSASRCRSTKSPRCWPGVNKNGRACGRPKRERSGLGGRRQRLAHFLEGFHLDLADALGRDVELGREVVQREGVLLPQPARLDDAAAARVQGGEGGVESRGFL